MIPQPQQAQTAHPWQGKGLRFSLILALAFASYLAFALYDGREFYARYLKQCQDEPDRADCRPLNIVKASPRPELDIKLDYGKGSWAIQVTSQQEEGQANALAAQLQSAGINARIIKIKARKKRTLCQVQIGRFIKRKDATEAGKQLQERGIIQSFIPTMHRTP
jgi:SPOR domain